MSRRQLDLIDERAAALGVCRSDLVRRLLRAGLEDAPVEPGPFAVEPLGWEDTARRLQQLAPERWSLPDPLDDFLRER